MTASNKIQQWIAAFLLLAFALVVTPKRLLHHWLVKHATTEQCDSGQTKLIPECPCDDLVTIPAFLEMAEGVTIFPIKLFPSVTIDTHKEHFANNELLSCGLRGPPTMAI